MARGSGKFKAKRGGGRPFSKDMTFDTSESSKAARGLYEESDLDEEDEEEESEEESSSEEEEADQDPNKPERVERKVFKQKQAGSGGDDDGLEDDSDLINPNHFEEKLNVSDLSAPRELSLKEREALLSRQAAAAKRKAEAESKQAELKAKQAATGSRR